MAADDKTQEIIVPDWAVTVRETRTLFRLTPRAKIDLGAFGRQVAIVAADTEHEARKLAVLHDPLGRDWPNPDFAFAEATQTSDHHVFGDVVFQSEPVAAPAGTRPAQAS